ncbi:MAG: dimethylmenaquinone methyltransferase [Bryobacteraceae bacterium]
MKRSLLLLSTLAIAAQAQVFTFTRDQMIQYTVKNPYARFEDGRPNVPGALLEKVKGLSSEEIWAVLPRQGYPNQYEGNWQILHPGRKLVGRAVTAQFMPLRPDVAEVAEAAAKTRGAPVSPNQRVIDMLQPGDVLVVDLYGKIEDGTFVGDNLAFYIAEVAKSGLVVDGAIRDIEGVFPLDMALYFRGAHPSFIRNVMLTGINIPVRIGSTTVMPGDVVFGDREGVSFIPPHLVQEVVDRAEETHIHDEWTRKTLRTGKYKSSEIYGSPKDERLKKEYDEYLKRRLGRP